MLGRVDKGNMRKGSGIAVAGLILTVSSHQVAGFLSVGCGRHFVSQACKVDSRRGTVRSILPDRRPKIRPRSLSVMEGVNGIEDGEVLGQEDYTRFGYNPDYEIQDENSFEDEETLMKWRNARVLSNDLWMFNGYNEKHAGDWLGNWVEYKVEESRLGGDPDEELQLGLVQGGSFVATTQIVLRGKEERPPMGYLQHSHKSGSGSGSQRSKGVHDLPPPVLDTLYTDSFRAVNGTQAVGNAYTLGAKRTLGKNEGDCSSPCCVWAEVGMREENVRVRCIFQYVQEQDISSIHRIYVVREGLRFLPAKKASDEALLYGAAGRGLYDPPRLSQSPMYYSMYAEGGLTLRFPLKIETGKAGVISVDWIAGRVRYQADRTFSSLGGECNTLEVTEILTEDAERFPPQERM
ncbi:unnamed protein product [Choristocarpus tenellus]